MKLVRSSIWVGIFFLFTAAVDAKPYTPKDDNEILESTRLSISPELRKIRELNNRIEKQPDNLSLTLQLFEKYIVQARNTGDPVYVGYAEALIQRSAKQKNINPSLLIARATVRKHNHDFIGAINDLARVLADDPKNVQARILRSNIYRIQGAYTKALTDCNALTLLADPIVSSLCQLSIFTLSGKAEWAVQKLEVLLNENDKRLTPELREWGYTILAEGFMSLEQFNKAESYLRKTVIPFKKASVYIKTTYMDLLLSQRKYRNAYNFTSGNRIADTLLTRKAIAAERLNMPVAEELKKLLLSRYKDNKKIGRSEHLREQVLYELYLNKNSSNALQVAIKNWKQQREIIDTRLVLEAAISAGNPGSVEHVLRWIKKSGNNDLHIKYLASKIKDAKK